MNWEEVSRQLDDVPSTFKRPGDTYSWLFNSFVIGLLRYTNAADGVGTQLQFASAVDKWLDAWGQLFNFRRNVNESDDYYRRRIQFLLMSGKGSPAAIERYVAYVYGISVQLVELPGGGGYQLQVGSQVKMTYQQIINDLKFVRPAGVPFGPLMTPRGGLFLGTINYLGAERVTGAYLWSAFTGAVLDVAGSTNNSLPLLPTTFLTDPTLNPGLAA